MTYEQWEEAQAARRAAVDAAYAKAKETGLDDAFAELNKTRDNAHDPVWEILNATFRVSNCLSVTVREDPPTSRFQETYVQLRGVTITQLQAMIVAKRAHELWLRGGITWDDALVQHHQSWSQEAVEIERLEAALDEAWAMRRRYFMERNDRLQELFLAAKAWRALIDLRGPHPETARLNAAIDDAVAADSNTPKEPYR
jgi:hypothetical protein